MRIRQLERGRVCALRPLVACLALALSLGVNASAGPTDMGATALAAPFADVAPDQPTSIYLVENCDDAGQGSLRDAVNSANMAGVDATIKFDINAMGCSTISLKTGEIDVMIDNLTIQGPDPDVVTIQGGYSHGYYNRIFKHMGLIGAVLHLDHLVLTDAKYVATGNQSASGGCVLSYATTYLSNTRLENCGVFAASGAAKGGAVASRGAKLVNSVVTDAHATSQLGPAAGGGMRVGGSLNATYSTFSNSYALSMAPNPDSVGGGLSLYGPATFQQSTISGNAAALGGGLSSSFPVAMVNTTVAANTASGNMGAMRIHSALTLYNSTVAQNIVNALGAVGTSADSIYAVSSIFASNFARAGNSAVEYDVESFDGQITGSHDLIVVAANTTTPIDTRTDCPRLAPLLDNGGPTNTVGLLPASPAIDWGSDDFSLGIDQRGTGFPRVVGTSADIGAYEWSANSGDEINRNSFELCE